ncbi:MAG: S8 family serine peptidase, partial [Gammaproteobacteria bacterium]|nr:S8 family serine peptidase [Gammaproteobacteria bacterium]
SGSEYRTSTVRDEFNTNAWNNNDGDTDWYGNWGQGLDILIDNGALLINDPTSATYNFAVRRVYAKDTVAATLSFTYQRNFVSASTLDVQFSNCTNACNGTQTVYEIQGTGSDSTPQLVTIDLLPYLHNGDLFWLTFYNSSNGGLSPGSSIRIDDVQITFTTYRPDTDFTTLVDAYQVHNQSITGNGIAVAVLDTGVGYEGSVFYDADNFYNGSDSTSNRVPALYNAIQNVENTDPWYILGDTSDGSGHGTHMASIIGNSQTNNENGRKNGIAPLADIIPVNAFGSNGAGSYA